MASSRTVTPLGAYLERRRGTRSIRETAKAAGISEARWRQLVRGEQTHAGGITSPAHGKPSTVAAMARAVGGDPAEALRLAGFDDQVIAIYATPADLNPAYRPVSSTNTRPDLARCPETPSDLRG